MSHLKKRLAKGAAVALISPLLAGALLAAPASASTGHADYSVKPACEINGSGC